MNRKEQAQKIVQNHMLFAGGAGLVPIPGVDMVAVAAVQIEMLRQLSSLYEHTFSENQIKNYLSAFTGGILARLGSSALKGIPVIGTALGSATMALTSSARCPTSRPRAFCCADPSSPSWVVSTACTG